MSEFPTPVVLTLSLKTVNELASCAETGGLSTVLPASNSSMGMAAVLGCACVRRVNTETANSRLEFGPDPVFATR